MLEKMSQVSHISKENLIKHISITNVKVVDVQNGCYVVETAGGTRYILPEHIGEHINIVNGQLLAVGENKYFRLIIDSQDKDNDLNPEIPENLTDSQESVVMVIPEIVDDMENPQNSADDEGGEELDLLWKSSRNKTEGDVAGTIAFLELRSSEKYEKLFNDKKTIKTKVWQMLVSDMEKKGFNVGKGKEGGERCRQKHYNLQKTYINFQKDSTRTGSERKPLPKYYDLLHKLFGSKHTVNPTFTMDSLQDTGPSTHQHSPYSNENSTDELLAEIRVDPELEKEPSFSASTPSTSRTPLLNGTSRFTLNHSRPKSNVEKIINVIKDFHKEAQEQNDRHFARIERLLEEQNKYKKEYLEFLKTTRKRSYSP